MNKLLHTGQSPQEEEQLGKLHTIVTVYPHLGGLLSFTKLYNEII